MNKNSSIRNLRLTTRAIHALNWAGIDTIKQLIEREPADLLCLKSFGNTSLREVQVKLKNTGYELGTPDDSSDDDLRKEKVTQLISDFDEIKEKLAMNRDKLRVKAEEINEILEDCDEGLEIIQQGRNLIVQGLDSISKFL